MYRVHNIVHMIYYSCSLFNYRIARQFTKLEQALLTWSDFEKHILELKVVLREEHTALDVLDQALKKNDGSVNMTSAMQNIVQYLPEKHRDGFLKVR